MYTCIFVHGWLFEWLCWLCVHVCVCNRKLITISLHSILRRQSQWKARRRLHVLNNLWKVIYFGSFTLNNLFIIREWILMWFDSSPQIIMKKCQNCHPSNDFNANTFYSIKINIESNTDSKYQMKSCFSTKSNQHQN